MGPARLIGKARGDGCKRVRDGASRLTGKGRR
jgi:hypothetical protein